MPNIDGLREAKRRLVASVVNSELLYAPPVWTSALNNHAIQKKLFSAQRSVVLRIVSAYGTVSTSAELVLTSVPPIDLLVEESKKTFQLRKELTCLTNLQEIDEGEGARWACGARRQRGPVEIASGPAPAVLRLRRTWLLPTSSGGGIFLSLPWLGRLVGLPNGRVAADGRPGRTDHGRVITVGVFVTVFLKRFQRFVNKNVSPHQGINVLFTITTLVLSFYICNINLFCRDYSNRNIIKVFINNYLPFKNTRVEIQQ